MIDRTHSLPVTRQCQLLSLNRSSVYYQPIGVSDEDLRLMRLIDEIHLKRPFYGSRRIRDNLQDLGHPVNRKKVQRLRRPVRFMMNLDWFRERGLVFLHGFTIAFSRA